MQSSTESLIFKAVVSAVYGINTLAELTSYYFDIYEEEMSEEVQELRKLMANAQLSVKAFAYRWEQHTNRGHAASKSIVVGTHKLTAETQQLVDKLRNTE